MEQPSERQNHGQRDQQGIIGIVLDTIPIAKVDTEKIWKTNERIAERLNTASLRTDRANGFIRALPPRGYQLLRTRNGGNTIRLPDGVHPHQCPEYFELWKTGIT
jgi:hypothetical protein